MRRLFTALLLVLTASSLTAATFTVTSTNDSGAGSLRQAILDANANAGADTIAFDIPGSDTGCDVSGVCTIAPLSALPGVTGTVTIDGYTQPSSSPNTNPVGQGLNTVLTIVLAGDGSFSQTGLLLSADAIVVRGLVIAGGFNHGLEATAHDGIKIAGCFIGTDSAGQFAAGNAEGVYAHLATNLVVGGTDPADLNLISGRC